MLEGWREWPLRWKSFLAGRVPLALIRDAKEGRLVRIRGRVRIGHETARAPSGQNCVAWRIAGSERQSAVDFLVEDDIGRALALASTGCTLDLMCTARAQ